MQSFGMDFWTITSYHLGLDRFQSMSIAEFRIFTLIVRVFFVLLVTFVMKLGSLSPVRAKLVHLRMPQVKHLANSVFLVLIPMHLALSTANDVREAHLIHFGAKMNANCVKKDTSRMNPAVQNAPCVQ